nr:uncharacterized mitochondrial protein AtMg00810-like [Tanacetum cinerariifolium]
MALADDEFAMGNNHAHNDEWIDITMRKVKRHNLDNKLLKFNTGRILVLKSEAVNECLKLTKAPTDLESSIELGSEPQTPLPPLILYCMKCKSKDHKTLDHEMYVASLKRSENDKAQPYHGGVVVESSESSESFIGMRCTTCGSNVYSTTDHNDFNTLRKSVAMSSPEAEYVDAAGCCANIMYMKSQFSDYDIHYSMVSIFCDNTSAIAISNNPDTNPPIDNSKARPLKELLIKFTMKNGQMPLTLEYKTFCESTGLDYNNGDSEDELKEDSDYEMLEAGEELDEEFLYRHPSPTRVRLVRLGAAKGAFDFSSVAKRGVLLF